MTIETNDLLNSILKSLSRIEQVKVEDSTNIKLYIVQVTNFMDTKLKNTARNKEEDKILTKTMINNYAKNNLLPPPVKKKYSKEHVLLLIFIYYYKGILSINDIQTLLNPVTENFFQNGKDFGLKEVYNEVFSMEEKEIEALKKDITDKFQVAQDTYQDAPKEHQEFLRMFSFISLLSYDVYVKKLLIEKMIDEIASKSQVETTKDGKKESKKESKKDTKKDEES